MVFSAVARRLAKAWATFFLLSWMIVIANGFNQYLHTLVGLTISDSVVIGDTSDGSMAAGF